MGRELLAQHHKGNIPGTLTNGSSPRITPPVEEHTQFGRVNILDSLAENTKINYEIDLSLFGYWLLGHKPEGYQNAFHQEKHYEPIPLDQSNRVLHLSLQEVAELFSRIEITPTTISTWLQDLGFYYKVSTLRRKLSAINWMFNALEMDVPSAYPQVKQTFRSLVKLQNQYKGSKISRQEIMAKRFNPPPEERTPKTFKKKQSTPFRLEHLQAVLGYLTFGSHSLGDNRVTRDKAIISLAWHGLFRRSEVADIRIENLEFKDKGMTIHLYDTKSHEEEKRHISYANNPMLCPVRLVRDWVNRLENKESGWLFKPISKADNIREKSGDALSGRDIMRVLIKCCTVAGLEEKFSGHSTRSGGATEIYIKTRDGLRVQRTGSWKSDVWKDYVRDNDDDNFDNTGMQGIT